MEGIDAAHKLTILASLSFGIPLQFDACYTEGISKITRDDVSYAEELGYRISTWVSHVEPKVELNCAFIPP